MVQEVEWRSMREADIQACIHLQHKVFAYDLWEGYDSYALLQQHGKAYVACDSDRIVGYLTSHFINPDVSISELHMSNIDPNTISTVSSVMCIHDFVIDPEYQGTGIGKRFIKPLTNKWKHTLGVSHIRLLSIPSAIGFWQKLGFTFVSMYEGSAYPQGSWIMERNI